MIFASKNRNFRVTYLETSLFSNGLHEAKSRVRFLVSTYGQSGIPIILYNLASPLNYLSTKFPVQILVATMNVVNSEHTHTHTHTVKQQIYVTLREGRVEDITQTDLTRLYSSKETEIKLTTRSRHVAVKVES